MKRFCLFFFFSSRRRHTRWNCDWSSDVCSSDLDHGANRLAGENVFGQYEPHSYARERNGRENTGHQNEGDKTRENQEEEIVAGVERRECDKNDPAEINPTLKGDAVLHFVTDPAERRALCENRNERHAHPAGDSERGKRRSAGERELACFRGGTGIQRQEERSSEGSYREKKCPHSGAVGLGPELRDG